MSAISGSSSHPADIQAAFAEDGWTDAELMAYIDSIVREPDPMAHIRPLWSAILTPTLPKDEHKDPKFYEVLAWYLDKTTSQAGDGMFTLAEVQEQLVAHGQKYLSMSMQPDQQVARLQSWKFVQKLRLLEGEIRQREARGEGAFYPYRAREMTSIDGAEEWNAANTIDTRAEFNDRVIARSYDRPVLVKYGLTFCAHCLLLEQMGSVPALGKKYESDLDVVKLWWNPHDPELAEVTAVAGEQGVTSSPFFCLYEDGKIVKSGYGFPDERGEGMEDFLAGYVN
ncbi:MAG: thioredoxin family protein [Planctomycetota bacterium]|jgi:hypothetical protein